MATQRTSRASARGAAGARTLALSAAAILTLGAAGWGISQAYAANAWRRQSGFEGVSRATGAVPANLAPKADAARPRSLDMKVEVPADGGWRTIQDGVVRVTDSTVEFEKPKVTFFPTPPGGLPGTSLAAVGRWGSDLDFTDAENAEKPVEGMTKMIALLVNASDPFRALPSGSVEPGDEWPLAAAGKLAQGRYDVQGEFRFEEWVQEGGTVLARVNGTVTITIRDLVFSRLETAKYVRTNILKERVSESRWEVLVDPATGLPVRARQEGTIDQQFVDRINYPGRSEPWEDGSRNRGQQFRQTVQFTPESAS